MNLEYINQFAWEIAIQSIMYKNRKFEVYSNTQIRGFLELAKSSNFEKEFDAHINRYSPQPSRRQNPRDIANEQKKLRELNKVVGNRILAVLKKLTPRERMKFSQYLLWNIEIIKQNLGEIERIKLILDSEKVAKPEIIEKYLSEIIQNNMNPTTKYKRANK